MHIPDSALGPGTSLAAVAAMLPVWYLAARRLRDTLATRRVPLLALGAAFCFTIMMFNIPVPGGTTVHATGGVLLAALLGPWAAVAGMTVTLAIQALLFADGGVLALGANAWAMALAMPFAGYGTYRLIAGRTEAGAARRALAAGIGAFVGLNAAALAVAVLLGIQPALHHDASGRALYFPFGLGVTVPAMLAAHLTVAGLAEAAVTFLAVRSLQRAGIPLADVAAGARAPCLRDAWLWAALGALVALTPLGLLAGGAAWGEWDVEEIAERAGYAPAGLVAAERESLAGRAPLPDYLGERGALAYALAGLAGAASVAALLALGGRTLARRERGPGPPPPRPGTSPGGGLPEWLRSGGGEPRPPPGGPQRGLLGRRISPRGFVERTLGELAETGRAALLAEGWSRREGLLQRLDPRAKILGLLAFVGLASLVRDPAALAALLVLAILLARLSRIPAAPYLRRVWLAVPLAFGAVILPAALSPVTPGPALLVLARDPYVAVTTTGLLACARLTLRVGAAVSFVTLLSVTTRWSSMLRGLRALGVPRPFVEVLGLAHRYAAVLMRSASEAFVARKSRTVGRVSAASGRGFLGSLAGALLGKTLALADEVHEAMVSRGWTGEARTLEPLRLRAPDAAWLAAMGLAAGAVALWSFLG